MNNKHTVIITFRAKESELQNFTNLMATVKNDLPTVEGCNGVSILRHKDDASIFTLIEDWSNQEAHSSHIDGLITSGNWAKIEAMLVDAPSTSFATQI